MDEKEYEYSLIYRLSFIVIGVFSGLLAIITAIKFPLFLQYNGFISN